jgi:hypothetical protein
MSLDTRACGDEGGSSGGGGGSGGSGGGAGGSGAGGTPTGGCGWIGERAVEPLSQAAINADPAETPNSFRNARRPVFVLITPFASNPFDGQQQHEAYPRTRGITLRPTLI